MNNKVSGIGAFMFLISLFLEGIFLVIAAMGLKPIAGSVVFLTVTTGITGVILMIGGSIAEKKASKKDE